LPPDTEDFLLSVMYAFFKVKPFTVPQTIKGKPKTYMFEGHDGTNLIGYFFKGGKAKKKKYPTVLMMPPPGVSALALIDYVPLLQSNRRKVNVLLLEPRAHGESGGKYYSLGHKESEDVLAILESIKNNKYSLIDPNNIIGFSFVEGMHPFYLAVQKGAFFRGLLWDRLDSPFYASVQSALRPDIKWNALFNSMVNRQRVHEHVKRMVASIIEDVPDIDSEILGAVRLLFSII